MISFRRLSLEKWKHKSSKFYDPRKICQDFYSLGGGKRVGWVVKSEQSWIKGEHKNEIRCQKSFTNMSWMSESHRKQKSSREEWFVGLNLSEIFLKKIHKLCSSNILEVRLLIEIIFLDTTEIFKFRNFFSLKSSNLVDEKNLVEVATVSLLWIHPNSL